MSVTLPSAATMYNFVRPSSKDNRIESDRLASGNFSSQDHRSSQLAWLQIRAIRSSCLIFFQTSFPTTNVTTASRLSTSDYHSPSDLNCSFNVVFTSPQLRTVLKMRSGDWLGL
ncbi:hypothetical protein FRB94_001579 [Tulasnella sp. JGI-2019a]|nr:hypothetical protein FRB94_001579 [Tulasnella sp. JGI-2019a]